MAPKAWQRFESVNRELWRPGRLGGHLAGDRVPDGHRLREEERGVATLEAVGGSLRRVIPIVLAHHGRFDGSGDHPTAGAAIPLEARIIAVADVYRAQCLGQRLKAKG